MSDWTSIVYSLVISFLIVIFGIIFNKLNLSVADITEKDKCPACYGFTLCRDIDEVKLYFQYTDFYSIFNNIFGSKNVYYGKYGNEKIIMKKLAHQFELEAFDQMICADSKYYELCPDGKPTIGGLDDRFYKFIQADLNDPDMTNLKTKIRLCPTTEKFGTLLENLRGLNTEENFYKVLWTSLKINPEPVILQILKAEDDWPTPKYFGACGRLIIEEYVGFPLLSFTEEPWITRAVIASSLLDAAHQFTFRNPEFAFYMTDISMDNIAVNDQNKPVFIDLENIIIVDKHPLDEITNQIETWNQTHSNEVHSDCQDCFIFSPLDVCNHKISDFNYYAICKHILVKGLTTAVNTQGLLHNPSENVLQKYPSFSNLLKECAEPQIYSSRIEAGAQLKKMLDIIIAENTT